MQSCVLCSMMLTLSEEKRREGEPQCSAKLVLPGAFEFWISLVFQDPNNEHSVNHHKTSHYPHFLSEWLQEFQCLSLITLRWNNHRQARLQKRLSELHVF